MKAALQQPPTPEEGLDHWLESLPAEQTSTFKGHTACIELIQPEARVFCDAGSGLQTFIESEADRAEGVHYHFFMSHLHWDHIQGFPFFKPAYSAKNRITFHTFHAEAERLLRQQMAQPCFPVDFDGLEATIDFEHFEAGCTLSLGALKVRTMQQPHPGDSCGYRFELGDHSIVYSSDCEHGPDAHNDAYPFLEFYRDADVLIFDAQFSLSEANTSKRSWGHSNPIVGVELAVRAGARHLVFFHHDRLINDQELARRLAQAQAYRAVYAAALGGGRSTFSEPRKISLAFDGLRIDPHSPLSE